MLYHAAVPYLYAVVVEELETVLREVKIKNLVNLSRFH